MTETAVRGSLRWAIRESFLRYITVIARGTVDSDGVITDHDGAFVFPLRAASEQADGWHLSFGGSLRFTAHAGFLDVLIAAPEVVVGPSGGILVTHTNDPAESLQGLLEVDPTEPRLDDDGTRVWQAVPTRLLAAAEAHFGSVYPAGTEMAPLTITMCPLHS